MMGEYLHKVRIAVVAASFCWLAAVSGPGCRAQPPASEGAGPASQEPSRATGGGEVVSPPPQSQGMTPPASLAALKKIWTRPLPVVGSLPPLRAPLADGTESAPFIPTATLTFYEYPQEQVAGKAQTVTDLLYECELSSPDPNISWSWRVWTVNEQGLLSADWVFAADSGGWLAWRDSNYLRIAPIGAANSAEDTMKEAYTSWPAPPPGELAVPVLKLVPPKRFELTGTGPRITPTSISSDAPGHYIIKVTGKDPGVVFTIIGDGTHWRLK